VYTFASLTQAGAVGVFNLPLRTIDSPFGDVRPALEANLMQDIARMVLVLHLPRESAYVAARTTVWFWNHAFKVDAVDGSIELPWRASVTRPNEHVDPTMAPLPAWSIDVELGHVNHLFVSGTASFLELPRMEGLPLDPVQRVERFLARRQTSEALTLPVHNMPVRPRLSGWSRMEIGPIATGDLVRAACRLHAARVRILQRTGRHLSSTRRGLQLAHGRRPEWPLFQVRA
jgi:hypothetical protein